MSVQQNAVVRHEMTRPHPSVGLVELGTHRYGQSEPDGSVVGLARLVVAQGEPRNAGPPAGECAHKAKPMLGWGLVDHEGVRGYGERLANGKVRYWRPLPEQNAGFE